MRGGMTRLACPGLQFSIVFQLTQARGKLCSPRSWGRLAQLVEHLVYTERVGSSNLSPPTIFSPTSPA